MEVKALHAGYNGRKVLRGLNFTLGAGKSVALLGPNGCGKSTLFKVIMGLVCPQSGDVEVNDKSMLNESFEKRCRRGLGYLWQTTNVFPSLTVDENFGLVTMGERQPPDRIALRKTTLLSAFPMLKDHLSKRAGLLSGGERQALALSMVLMRPAQVLLLDEPIAALSQKAGQEILGALSKLQEEEGFAMVIVEHRLRQIQTHVDRIVVMQHGVLVADTTDTTRITDADWLHNLYNSKPPS